MAKEIRVLMLTNLDKKTAKKYVIAKMFQDANGASCGPNANKFTCIEVLEIGVPFFTNISHIYCQKKKILKHIHWTMRFIPHISTPKKDWYGITYIAHIKDNVRMFLQCGLLIANRFLLKTCSRLHGEIQKISPHSSSHPTTQNEN